MTLYYLNNDKIYRKHLINGDYIPINNMTIDEYVSDLIENYDSYKDTPDNLEKYVYNYLILGLISLISSFFGFAIRDTFNDWKIDICFFTIVK